MKAVKSTPMSKVMPSLRAIADFHELKLNRGRDFLVVVGRWEKDKGKNIQR